MTIVPAPRPCGSCPYRLDVPAGVWAAHEYEKLPPYDNQTAFQPPSAFFCHQADGHLCAGWVGCHDMRHNLGFFRLLVTGMQKLDPGDIDAIANYATDVPLFASGTEAALHGLSGVANPSPEAQRLIDRLTRKQERRQ
jgi:hypothetical protein